MRNDKGQFVKGNGGGPGRPQKKREDKYLEIALNTVTFADWKAIIEKAAQQAMKGDAQARKWLADYLIGPPGQKLDVTSAGAQIKAYISISPDDWDKATDG